MTDERMVFRGAYDYVVGMAATLTYHVYYQDDAGDYHSLCGSVHERPKPNSWHGLSNKTLYAPHTCKRCQRIAEGRGLV